MKYSSTNHRSNLATASEAVFQGLADDGGLFMPVKIPLLRRDFFVSLPKLDLPAISYEVAKNFLSGEPPDAELRVLIEEVLEFPIPLVKLDDRLYVLELFHGPTLAFKDVGARFMARLVAALGSTDRKPVTVLVATSGDTGSAVAHGFLDVPGTRVVILYPSGRVSDFQERQFVCLGKNISALEVSGSFDDCQALVKGAFNDRDLRKRLRLASANSINIARLIPQTFYYYWAVSQLGQLGRGKNGVQFVVPSGNFGNLTAGLFAKKSGLDVKRFIAATNSNDTFCRFLESGVYEPRRSVQTASNAMDVGDPSNYLRINALYQGKVQQMREEITAVAISEQETRETIKRVYDEFGYVSDPHTAVGFAAAKRLSDPANGADTVVLSTAHPIKFRDVVEEVIGSPVPRPAAVPDYAGRPKLSTPMAADGAVLKDFLLQ